MTRARLAALAIALASACAAPPPDRRAVEVVVTPGGELVPAWYWTTGPPDQQTDLLGLYDPDR